MKTPAIPPALRHQINRGRERFLALTQRERWMVIVAVAVMLWLILYMAVYKPVVDAHARREASLLQARSVAEQLEKAAALRQSAPSRAPVQRGGSLLAVVDQSIQSSGIGKSPERIQPEGDREVRVWFRGVPFDPMVRWLGELQTRYGVSVQTLDVERSGEAGVVDARLSLVRS